MKKHILVVSQYFYPEQFRINDMAAEWVKRGYEVTVLTGIPNYPRGKFYDGYGWFKKRKEIYNGVKVIRIPLFARGSSSIGMVLNYLSFVFFGAFWKTFTRQKADCVFNFEVSPMTQALVGVWFAKRRKIPCYIYVQDLWPENVEIVTGIKSKAVITPLSKMVNYIYKNCDKIFATSPSFVENIRERVEDKEKVVYWPQYAEDFYCATDKKSELIVDDGALNITFTGNIGTAQGLEILPQTAKLLRGRGLRVRFNIVGEGRNKENLLKQIKEADVEDSFNMIGWQAPENIPSILAASDAAFLSFADNPLYSMTIPAKLQSYMACSIPVIASASGETERIINDSGCGFCAKIGDAEALANSIEIFAQSDRAKMAEASGKYFKEHFTKEMLMNEIEEYIF